MYGRTISFTLLAPSLWAVLEAIAKTTTTPDMTRYAFKTGDNSGVIIEIFANKEIAGSQLDSCLLYTSPSPRDLSTSRMPSSA